MKPNLKDLDAGSDFLKDIVSIFLSEDLINELPTFIGKNPTLNHPSTSISPTKHFMNPVTWVIIQWTSLSWDVVHLSTRRTDKKTGLKGLRRGIKGHQVGVSMSSVNVSGYVVENPMWRKPEDHTEVLSPTYIISWCQIKQLACPDQGLRSGNLETCGSLACATSSSGAWDMGGERMEWTLPTVHPSWDKKLEMENHLFNETTFFGILLLFE